MQSPNQPENIELRIRTLRTLWLGMLGSIGGYYALTFIVERPEGREPNDMLFLVLMGMALSAALASFPIKSKLISRAIERQDAQLVQQAYIVAWAMCEVAGLLGVLDFFLTANRHYYVLFIIGAVGQLIHFPRREDVMNAAFKRPLG